MVQIELVLEPVNPKPKSAKKAAKAEEAKTVPGTKDENVAVTDAQAAVDEAVAEDADTSAVEDAADEAATETVDAADDAELPAAEPAEVLDAEVATDEAEQASEEAAEKDEK
jgi:large subunit ribosomal protein L17